LIHKIEAKRRHGISRIHRKSVTQALDQILDSFMGIFHDHGEKYYKAESGFDKRVDLR